MATAASATLTATETAKPAPNTTSPAGGLVAGRKDRIVNKYRFFSEHNDIALWGEDLTDALTRQKVIHTQKRTRRGDNGDLEYSGGEPLRIKQIIEVLVPEHSERGGKQYLKAICELDDDRIIEVDAVEEEQAGRPPMYGQKMRQTALYLPDEMLAWLKAQPGTASETVRDLVSKAMTTPTE